MSWEAVLVLLAFFGLVGLGWRVQRHAAPSVGESVDESEGEAEDAPPADPDAVGVIAIEDAIDLHGFHPRDILGVVESYLHAAVEEGLTEVRLIHGRGKGVQRRRVQDLLAGLPSVESFGDAPAHRGGWGATIVRLHHPRTSASSLGGDDRDDRSAPRSSERVLPRRR